MPECRDCAAITDAAAGRWVILGEKSAGAGFDWMFICLACVRAWRCRGLVRAGHTKADIIALLDREYPLVEAKR